jgi:hypothetical protein
MELLIFYHWRAYVSKAMVLRDEFIVTKKDGTVRIFKQSEKGLYYLDTTQSESNHAVLINTVTNNQYKYSNKDYSQALLARKIQRIIGRPSTRQYLAILNNNLLPNSPVTYHDIVAAENIFGPDVGSLYLNITRMSS